jgi:hypothetical protein
MPRVDSAARFATSSSDMLSLLKSVAVGVGNNPDAVADVIGAEGSSRDAIPQEAIPERGQVSENVSQPETKQAWCVLHDDELGSNFANESGILAPETRARTFEASALSSHADVLARESADDDIDFNSGSGQSVGCESADVFIAGNLRPMLSQHALAKFVDFAERYGLKSARALQAQIKAANPREKGQHAQLLAMRSAVMVLPEFWGICARVGHVIAVPSRVIGWHVLERPSFARGPSSFQRSVGACSPQKSDDFVR